MQKLSEKQWKALEEVIDEETTKTGGRPRLHNRRIVEGILWVFFNGGKWSHVPVKYGSYVTVWRRFREWEESGMWVKIWQCYLSHLSEKERLGWTISFLNGNFVPTIRGGSGS